MKAPETEDLFVLSAGRTGTVFLEKLLSVYAPHLKAEHEPSPTREQMMLANLRNDFGIGKRVLRWWFKRSREARLRAANGPYVELNPFLCAMTDLLCDGDRPTRIVHITRAPESWARSMTVFKASSKFRLIIDYVPFAKPYPSPRPAGWRNWSFYRRNLARWAWCNARIRALQNRADYYVHIRYEDLFSADAAIRQDCVMKVFDTLGLERPERIDWSTFDVRVNPAPPSSDTFEKVEFDPAFQGLKRELGYAD